MVEPGRDFVRAFGGVRRRRRGGHEAWVGEEFVCSAARALRLPTRLRPTPRVESARRFAVACSFRHLLCGAGPVARIEIGVSLRPIGDSDHAGRISADAVLGWTSALPVAVVGTDRTGTAAQATARLIEAGPALARALLHATTTMWHPTERDWVEAGEPLVFVDADPGELIDVPAPTRDLVAFEGHRIGLAHLRLSIGQRSARVWLMTGDRARDQDLARRLRLHLVRLHTERECLRMVLRRIAVGRLVVEPGSPASERLQRYLHHALGVLERRLPYGIAGAELLRTAAEYDDLVEPGVRTTLLDQLTHIRRQLLERVRRATAGPAQTRPQTIYYVQPGATMHQYNIKLGDHNVVHGDFVVAERIQNSFNRASEGDGSANLREQLQQLAREVADLVTRLPDEKAREAARDLDVLTQEALSPSPRRKWYQLAGEGLIEAAHAVGSIAGNVIKIVKGVLAILGS